MLSSLIRDSGSPQYPVISARYSQEWSKWRLHYPRYASRSRRWQTTLLANCPAGKLPCWQTFFWNCWQTALLANSLLQLLAKKNPAGKKTLQESPSALDAVKSRTDLPPAEFTPAQGTPHQGVLAPQKIEWGIWSNFKKYYSLCY